ncbi:MAG: hypothetical protein JWO82_3642 [Akkermansiaceae bacterium]|nr:hypothetical protein [Akkermansiaceae bacterium]
MPEYEYAHEAPYTQLVRWWEGLDPIPANFGDNGLDWVAAELVEHGEEGITLLKKAFAPGAPAERRSAAIDALASPQVDDEEVDAAMLEDFTADPERRLTMLWNFIHMGSFPVDRETLESLTQTPDERLRAAKMVYLSRLLPEESGDLLAAALADPSVTMKEAACDEIGEWGLVEFRPQIEAMLEDENPDIVAAAEGCLDMLDLDEVE